VPYLTPDSIPEDDDCRPLSIPADSVWLALFGGALTELTKPYNWQQFGALTVDQTVAKMEEIIAAWYNVPCAVCMTPGGYRVIRINAIGQLEQLNAEGEWEPATDEYYIPPPAAREGGTAPDQNCLAAKNATNALRTLYEGLSESWNNDLNENEAITALIALAVATIGFAFAPITWAVAAFFLAVFEVLYAGLRYVTADLWDDAVSDQITCFLLDCAINTDGVVTFDWECFNEHLNSLADSFGLSEVQLRFYVQIGYLLYFIGGADGLNLAGATTEITDDDCTMCDEPWCYTFDFTVDDGSFVLQYPPAGGLWVDGVGWQSTYYDNEGGGVYRFLQITRGVGVPPGTDFTSVEMEFSWTSGTMALCGEYALYLYTDLGELASVGECDTPPASPYLWEGAAVVNGIGIALMPGSMAGALPDDPGGLVVLTRMTCRGTGVNPFGEDNCE